jgi:diaminopimelate decarboxylase
VGQGLLTPILAESGLARRHDGTLALGEVALSHIADAVGTPTFVYDAAGIRMRYRTLTDALASLPARICYAVKANGNLAVLRLLADLGAGADIVSGGELLRALTAGFPPERIVFSGVGKSDEELLAALAAGIGCINVESISELQRLVALTELHQADAVVGLRINPDVVAGAHPYITTGKGGLKFGVPADQVASCLALLDEAPRLRLGSLAMHLGSQLLDPAPFERGVDRLIDALAQVREAGFAPDTLDLGGGFGVRYRDEKPPTIEEWIAPVRARLAESGCMVQVEPGRYLVANAGVLLTRVLHRKHSGGREIAIVDAGLNDLLRPALYGAWHAIVPVEAPEGAEGPVDVVGPVCESGDFLALERSLPPVRSGQLLAVLGAGAYGFTMSSNYNARARAAEVLVDGGRWAVVRPRERLADLFRGEVRDPFGPEAP